jgi:hypothetical protein
MRITTIYSRSFAAANLDLEPTVPRVTRLAEKSKGRAMRPAGDGPR